jgi:hypothetical protein
VEVFVVGNLKTAAAAATRRQLIVRLNHEGLSNVEIGVQAKCSTRTVISALHHYLDVEARFPLGSGITQAIIDEQRAQEYEHLEGNQRYILKRLKRLHELVPADNVEETKIADSIFKGTDAFNRTSERKAKLYGWDPHPDTNITNNALIMVGSHEADIVKMLSQKTPIYEMDGSPVLRGEEGLAPLPTDA